MIVWPGSVPARALVSTQPDLTAKECLKSLWLVKNLEFYTSLTGPRRIACPKKFGRRGRRGDRVFEANEFERATALAKTQMFAKEF